MKQFTNSSIAILVENMIYKNICAEITELEKRKAIREKRRIIRDHDNLCGGSKPLQDALRDMKFIFDDDIEFIGIPDHKQIAGKKNMIVITRLLQTP